MSDKRTSKRLRASFTISYHVDKPMTVVINVGYAREIEALMLDLSEGGMAILTNYDIPVATELSIKFILINRALAGDSRIVKMQAEGRVCYNQLMENEEHRLGIRFTQITDNDKKAIADFIALSPPKNLKGEK
jgi:c-di-GMP-binding flagellar brake protein YcgR